MEVVGETPIPFLEARGGMRIPHIGVGTYELRGEECRRAVAAALQLGFRLIDTAAGYHNEEYVGEAIEESGVERDSLFVVVKIAPKAMSSEQRIEEGIRESVRKLRIVYADCVLIHWPGCGGRKPHEKGEHRAARRRCWKVMKKLQDEGIIRFLGVSNFAPRHFSSLEEDGDDGVGEKHTLFGVANRSKPMMNQIELHPLCVQQEVCDYCRENGVILQQYSPLGQNNAYLVDHPVLRAIVSNFFPSYSVYDVLIMWGLSQGFCVIVRSASEEHLKQNWKVAAKAFFSSGVLSEQQMVQLRCLHDSLDIKEDHHFCWHSDLID